MALTRVKPVVSHCAVAASTFISVMMEGKAGVTRVWFSTVTNVPKIMTTSIIIWCRANFKSKAPFRGVCRNVFGPDIAPRRSDLGQVRTKLEAQSPSTRMLFQRKCLQVGGVTFSL